MDFQSMMETFAEAWVAANTQTPLTEAAAAAADHVSRPSSLFFLLLFFVFVYYLAPLPLPLALRALTLREHYMNDSH